MTKGHADGVALFLSIQKISLILSEVVACVGSKLFHQPSLPAQFRGSHDIVSSRFPAVAEENPLWPRKRFGGKLICVAREMLRPYFFGSGTVIHG